MSTPEPPVSARPTGDPSAVGVRMLYMLVFAVVFWILCWVLGVTAVLQLLFALLGDRPNPELTRFGASLAIYAREIIDFLTFASAKIPYPFTAWPEPPPSPGG
ncbi:MAG TPA: DUF4389 domain-containing protein [Steroidobacteraceae bacterium]|jgi:hypothetical protein|nr:DUF4389 domain-containing protein [Steroidobacteraceae bacterium]